MKKIFIALTLIVILITSLLLLTSCGSVPIEKVSEQYSALQKREKENEISDQEDSAFVKTYYYEYFDRLYQTNKKEVRKGYNY